MVYDFLEAAFPWILMGIFVAISCVWMTKKNKTNSEEELKENGKNKDDR